MDFVSLKTKKNVAKSEGISLKILSSRVLLVFLVISKVTLAMPCSLFRQAFSNAIVFTG